MPGVAKQQPAEQQPRVLGEQGERTRKKLMDAARAVFRERGYAAARVDDITQRAGTSHGAFYLYFSNKQDVLEAVAVETAEQMYALADRLTGVEMGEQGYQQLRSWVEQFVDTYEHHAPVVNAWIAADSEHESRFGKLGTEVLAQFSGKIAQTIEQAVASGQRHPVDPGIAAVALVAMLERLCYFWVVRGAPFERATVVETLTAIWYEAIFGQRLNA